MYLSALALASTAGLAAARPHASRLASRAVPSFPAGASWDIVLAKGDALSDMHTLAAQDFGVIDLDLFDNDASTIADVKAQNKQVICYFSAGSQEGWRSDAGSFKDGDVGQAMDGWPDEKWVNVKSENVRSIMKSRIQEAAKKGCTAVDPDNVDGFSDNQDGFGYDKAAYVDYVNFMAKEAASNNLAIGLKNAIDLIPDVLAVVQFAVNEQCHEYGECDQYKPFTDANKAVFNIEYGGNNCEQPAGVKLSTLIKPEDQSLTTLGGACKGSGEAEGTAPAQPAAASSSSAKPEASVPVSSASPTKTPAPTPTKEAATPTPTGANEEEEGDDQDENDDGEDDEDEAQEPKWGHHWAHHWGWGHWNRR